MDPHSPTAGFLWAHVLWLFYDHPDLTVKGGYQKYAPDLYKDPVLRFMNTYHFPLGHRHRRQLSEIAPHIGIVHLSQLARGLLEPPRANTAIATRLPLGKVR